MRSSENTFLARMGFADPDKKTSRHDLACAFIARPDMQTKLLQGVFRAKAKEMITNNPLWRSFPQGSTCTALHWEIVANPKEVATDVMLEGSRKGSLAFLDVRVKGSILYSFDLTVPRYARPQGSSHTMAELLTQFSVDAALVEQTDKIQKFKIANEMIRVSLGVEVKTFNMPIGTAIMQIKYYRENDAATAWALVTDYDILDVEKETLDRENIAHASLSLEFDTYVREQMKKLNTPAITL